MRSPLALPTESPTVADPPAEDAALSGAEVDAFVGALGGRAHLVAVLRIGSGDPAVDRILTLLDDPIYGGWPIPRLCTLAGLTVADFLRAYQQAMYARAEITVTKLVTDRLAAVVDDLLMRAVPHDVPCPACQGRPPLPGLPETPPTICAMCRGHGTILAMPTLGRQKIALELGKLITKAGPLLQQNNVVLPGQAAGDRITVRGPRGTLADLQTAVHDLLRPAPRATGLRGLQATPPSGADAPAASVVEGTLVEDAPEP